ncbi:MAG: transcription-repair coupling factor [Prevotella sp.]|nr:transcription-repair coupling factor [Prevotella sp.]
MDIADILKRYEGLPQLAALRKILEDKSVRSVFLQGLVASAAPVAFASLRSLSQPFLFLLSDADEAGYFYHDLTQLLGTERVLFFPSSYRRAVKYGQRDAANEILRTEVLSSLSSFSASPRREGEKILSSLIYIVSYPEAVAELVVSRKKLDDHIIKLTLHQSADQRQLVRRLRDFGFVEVDYVYEPGQFAVRGSIVDVYSYSSELPYRIDFFGDDIDSIRTFNVEDQLSKERKEAIEIVPDLALMDAEKIPFFNFLPDDAVIVARDFAFVRDTVAHIYDEGFSSQALDERLEGATEVERRQILRDMQKEQTLISPQLFDEEMSRFRTISIRSLTPGPSPRGEGSGYFPVGEHYTPLSPWRGAGGEAVLSFNTSPQPLFHKNFDLLRQTLDHYRQQGCTLYLLADSRKQQERLREILSANAEINFLSSVTLHEGFIDNDLKVCLFTDHQIFDRFHKYSLKSDGARAGKMALTMKELQEMEPGDFLVHVDFGIGKFGGLVRVPIEGGGYQEKIRLIYQRGDIVDVSIHSLYKISKYRRADTGEPPRLSTLGTGAWERMKERTKKRIKDIARDLIRIYAKRVAEKGFAYSPDSYLQSELEASFLYEDTPDQLRATQEVKADMEAVKPMDRLICGDVGFGKTEVAIRAAFKAACDSKQVAVLVPTTVLAFQHFQTFTERLRGMPVRVEYLSRARSAKQTKEILAGLADGKIDIIIGTHKLIGKTVKWKDLGLLIVDEEQKFGVSVKEKLRKLKTNVDTLTMTATPIPRTLQFSLMGARDMSIMRTPPPNRYPIQTDLSTFSREVICDAINFEMSRNGQVFFVCNRINRLQELALMIQKHIPDCRIAVGHGQMPPDELEQIVMGFINYDYDVLLSTTIVENGIDIPNANTIIIADAHKFGLSDLHQMRGRVGRSNKKAFCYLLAPPKSALTPEARRRLEALESFSGLGSGFNLAIQDLDIRGAGNLLGAEQSGFMEDLGYETYMKILKEAMAELRNEAPSQPPPEGGGDASPLVGCTPPPSGGGWEGAFVADCMVESDLEMYFPDTYVPTSSERVLLYRELDNIEADSDLEAYRRRLIDRFGRVPPEGEELMQVVALRRVGKRLGCEKIVLRQGIMIMQFVSVVDSPYYQSRQFGQILDYAACNVRRCSLKEVRGRRLMHVSEVHSVAEAVSVLRGIEAKEQA